jgi:hypothetical protein
MKQVRVIAKHGGARYGASRPPQIKKHIKYMCSFCYKRAAWKKDCDCSDRALCYPPSARKEGSGASLLS